MHFDTIIVGGGPAGLSAALVLGRCRRKVMVIDAGKPRNYAALHLHNYLSRDGINPRELAQIGRREMQRYGVEFRDGTVTSVACAKERFTVEVDGEPFASGRTLLLATGVVDDLPPIANMRDLYGRGVHHCPYCDGWEYRDRPIAAYGRGRPGVGLALNLLRWTGRVTVVTDGRKLSKTDRARCDRFKISVREEKIDRLEPLPDGGSEAPRTATPVGTDGVTVGGGDRGRSLERIVFVSGPPLSVDALFFNTGQMQRSRLPASLGCAMDTEGGVMTDNRQRTGVRGLYLAGDASREVQFVIVAAAEGATAGVAINTDLQERDQREVTASGGQGGRRPPRRGRSSRARGRG